MYALSVIHSAKLYLCAAEATRAIVNTVKPSSKNDHTHPGQFEYAVWIQIIRDTAEITKRHGVYPQPTKTMKTLLKELSNFHSHWTAPTKETQLKVTTHVRDVFSASRLLTTIGVRTLGQHGSFKERWPLPGIQLGLQAYKVRQEKKSKHEYILTGGKYHPFDDNADDPRDTIHFKQDGMNQPFKVKQFSDLFLNSDKHLLNPQVLATMIYKHKSITDKEKEKVLVLKRRYQSWKTAQNKEDPAYVKVVQYKESGGDNGGGGGGGESKKRITKGELKRPLEDMAGQLSQLHDYIDEKNVKAVNYLTGTVTDTFVKIAGICKVNTEPVYDFESDSNEANEDSYPDDDDDEEILKPPAKKRKIAGQAETNSGDSSKSSDSDEDIDSDDDKEETQDGKQPSKEGEEKGEDNEEREQDNELPDISSMKSCSREDITEFVAKMRASDKECDLRGAKAPGKIFREWLQLSKTPKGPTQMEFFYLFETSHKNEIASQFSNADDEDGSETDETWITHLVSFLKHINNFQWSNSFKHLPQLGNDKQGFFLLWLAGDNFEKMFYPQVKVSPRKPAKSKS